MAVDLWKYSEVLAEQLRLNGMKEEQVREVVAEVQHHVIATQQDPVEAFGQPTDYAMTWIRPRSRRWMMRIMAATAGVTSAGRTCQWVGAGAMVRTSRHRLVLRHPVADLGGVHGGSAVDR